MEKIILKKCTECNGTGYIVMSTTIKDYYITLCEHTTCWACDGKGKIVSKEDTDG